MTDSTVSGNATGGRSGASDCGRPWRRHREQDVTATLTGLHHQRQRAGASGGGIANFVRLDARRSPTAPSAATRRAAAAGGISNGRGTLNLRSSTVTLNRLACMARAAGGGGITRPAAPSSSATRSSPATSTTTRIRELVHSPDCDDGGTRCDRSPRGTASSVNANQCGPRRRRERRPDRHEWRPDRRQARPARRQRRPDAHARAPRRQPRDRRRRPGDAGKRRHRVPGDRSTRRDAAGRRRVRRRVRSKAAAAAARSTSTR